MKLRLISGLLHSWGWPWFLVPSIFISKACNYSGAQPCPASSLIFSTYCIICHWNTWCLLWDVLWSCVTQRFWQFPILYCHTRYQYLTKCSHLSSSISYTYSFIYSFANLPTPMTLSFHTALLKSFIKDSAYHWGTSFYPKKHFFFSCTHHIYLYLSNTASCFLIYIALIYIVSPSSHFFRL